ncbi:MAG: response regulator transcription factor [Ferruginibacter sp.]
MKIPIGIVDDKSQNRISLSEQIKYSDDIEIIFCATDGQDFLEQMKKCDRSRVPAVILMDIEMPVMDGIQAVQHGHILYPDLKFLMLTVFDDDEKIFEAIKAGANGYLLKDERVSVIIDHIQQLVDIGGVPMSPGIARKAMDLLMNASLSGKVTSRSPNPAYDLSERETEVLKLLVNGLDYKATAQKLFLSSHTVRKHIANIYQKLQVNSKAQVIKIANKNNLI